MVFDSQQQRDILLNVVQMVQIDAPIHVARQQIIQIDDMVQAILAGEVKAPSPPVPKEP